MNPIIVMVQDDRVISAETTHSQHLAEKRFEEIIKKHFKNKTEEELELLISESYDEGSCYLEGKFKTVCFVIPQKPAFI